VWINLCLINVLIPNIFYANMLLTLLFINNNIKTSTRFLAIIKIFSKINVDLLKGGLCSAKSNISKGNQKLEKQVLEVKNPNLSYL